MRIILKKNILNEQVIVSLYREHPLADAWIESGGGLQAGLFFGDAQCQLQCQSRIVLADEHGMLCPAWICRVVHGKIISGDYSFMVHKKGFSLSWITLSDKGARGERIDTSGPTILEVAKSGMDVSFSLGTVIPDEPNLLKAALVDACLVQRFDFVFTTGGTGIGPRDTTPEVTDLLLDKRLEGFERVMTAASMEKTPHGMISRAVAGIMGQSIVVNLPGSPKAVRENLGVLMPALQHAIGKLQGDAEDCGS